MTVLNEMEWFGKLATENSAQEMVMEQLHPPEKADHYRDGTEEAELEGVAQNEKLILQEDLMEIRSESEDDTDSITHGTDCLEVDKPKKVFEVKEREGKLRSSSGKVFNFQGKNLQVFIPMTTPLRTISSLTFLVLDAFVNQPNFSSFNGVKLYKNKTELHHANKMIRKAFIEIYKEMDCLRRYRTLNMLAFAKILKKFDRINCRRTQSIYLKNVESSYFNRMDKVDKLIGGIEYLFIKHFAEDDPQKTMEYLRPCHKKKSHVTTFFIGLFAGSFIALLAGYSVMSHIANLYTHQFHPTYMETAFPVLSIFSLLFLHFFLYGCNIVMWRRARINYRFIFEFSLTKELKYRDVFFICAAFMNVVIGVMFVHSFLTARGLYSTQVQSIPGLLFLLFLLLLLNPINVLYRSSRYHFLKVIRNIILAPLYKVVMVDFFVADQLCSQVPMLRDCAYMSCYYLTGSYKTQDYGFCTRNTHYRHLPYIISFLPYYWRTMQCARRWFDEGQTLHLANLGKYLSALIAATARVAYDNEKSIRNLFILITMSSIATVYQLYWDFVKDWGLLQLNSKNPGLRNELMLRWKFIYYLSMVFNIILRLAWLQIVLHFNFGSVDYRVTSFFLAALEVIRRGQGNFYRLENEHLNNAGNFRAVKAVPLPFHEVDEDD